MFANCWYTTGRYDSDQDHNYFLVGVAEFQSEKSADDALDGWARTWRADRVVTGLGRRAFTDANRDEWLVTACADLVRLSLNLVTVDRPARLGSDREPIKPKAHCLNPEPGEE